MLAKISPGHLRTWGTAEGAPPSRPQPRRAGAQVNHPVGHGRPSPRTVLSAQPLSSRLRRNHAGLSEIAIALTLDDVMRMCAASVAGELPVIDLRGIAHDQRHHQQLLPMAALSWWLLSAAPRTMVLLPEDQTALLPLARAGLLFVLSRDDVRQTTAASWRGKQFDLEVLRGDAQIELYIDWPPYAGLGRLPDLLAVRDLELPTRTPPPAALENRHYTWVDALSQAARRGSDDPEGGPLGAAWQLAARGFNGDTDQVLYELVSNVHYWAFQNTAVSDRRAVGICSISRGKTDRMHIVVMDNGCGIPAGVTKAQAEGRRHGADWRREAVEIAPTELHDDPAAALIHVLTQEAHGDRNIDRQAEGCGLFTSRVLAERHQGGFHLLTSGGLDHLSDEVLQHDRAQGRQPRTSRLSLPGARGTLALATLALVRPGVDADVSGAHQPVLSQA